MDTIIRIGNTAPTNSFRRAATAEEAGHPKYAATASKDVDHEGNDQFYVIDKQPVPGVDKSVTAFVIPDGYSLVDAARDIGLAFSAQHSDEAPEWVHSDDEQAAALIAGHLSALHGASVPALDTEELDSLLGASDPEPEESEDGAPPIAGGAIQAIGRDLWAQALGDMSGDTGTSSSAPTGTTLTDGTKSWTTNQWAGKDVAIGSVVGTVLSNTPTVLTIARWETPGSRSGATATTPASGTYQIHAGQCPAAWVALTANNTTPTTGGGDTTLTGEITTAGSGFLRKVIVYGHTAGTNTYTLTGTFTATGSDSFPQNVNKFGVFNAQNGGRLLFETLFSATFTANATGDNVQLTETVTGT